GRLFRDHAERDAHDDEDRPRDQERDTRAPRGSNRFFALRFAANFGAQAIVLALARVLAHASVLARAFLFTQPLLFAARLRARDRLGAQPRFGRVGLGFLPRLDAGERLLVRLDLGHHRRDVGRVGPLLEVLAQKFDGALVVPELALGARDVEQ